MSVMKAVLRDTAGMTVAEVIIALGVIMVGLLALVSTIPMSTSAIAESNLKTTAAFLAQQRLEQIKNAQWCSTCGAAGVAIDCLGGAGSNGTAAVSNVCGKADSWPDEAYNTIVIPSGDTNASYPRFSRQVRIIDCSVVSCSGIATGTASANTLRQVTVTVSFRPLTGTGTAGTNDERVQVVTLIAQRL
jgi:Tfp pilus assembly protein PilV